MPDPYRSIAKHYDRIIEPFNTGLRKLGMKQFPPREGMLVLDVGCGTGTHLDLYRRHGCLAIGLDRSPAMLGQAARKLKTLQPIHQGDATRLPYRDGVFDLVVFCLVLHELPGPVRAAALGEASRVLEPDGRVLVLEHHPGRRNSIKGWLFKGLNTFFEIAAGREHYRNFRSFMAAGGAPELLAEQDLEVETSRVVGGGNVGLFVAKKTDLSSGGARD